MFSNFELQYLIYYDRNDKVEKRIKTLHKKYGKYLKLTDSEIAHWVAVLPENDLNIISKNYIYLKP